MEDENITLIENILEHLRGIKGIRPVKVSQLHITLKFLGEITEKESDTVKQALSSIELPSFSLNFSNLGCFPNERRPRVVWVGIDQGHQELIALTKEVEKRLSALGFPREKRRFSPHLTLGRIKFLKEDDKEQLTNFMQSFDGKNLTTEKISTPIFKKSTLTPKGAIYDNLAEFPLLKNITE